MTDYNKETVAKLRQILKDKSIPSTGLTRKAQIIEKLEEWDSNHATEGEAVQSEESEEAAEAVTEEKGDEPPKPDDEVSGKETPAEEAPEPATSVPDTEQPAEKAEDVADTSAPEATEHTTAPEAQEENVADIAPKEDSQPAKEEAEQAQIPTDSHATDFARTHATPSPSPDEKLSIERPELLSIPERSTTTTADPSRLNTEELEADSKKRKRRSLTPELSAQEVRAKKPRPSEDAVHEVAPPVDEDTVMDQRAPEEAVKELDENALQEEATNGHQASSPKVPDADAPAEVPKDSITQPTREAIQPEKKDRYRDAFKPASSTPADAPTDLPEDDRSISPALHPATPSLYIRNLMRPLRPDQLRTHLVSLASPPGTDPDPDIISSLFLDSMKTHALVRFASTTAASRVRASLHGTIWPPEGNRKDLWVDFVPDSSCSDWIKEEEDAIAAEKEARAAGQPIPAKKFEVAYMPPGEDREGYEAVFQEVGAGAAAFNPPKGPRRESHQVPPTPTAREVPQETRQNAEQSFKTLDELFSSTIAKPKLYFLPVSDERADARRKELELETSRDWTPEEKRKGRGIQTSRLDQKARFTFDDEDRVVEAGGDFGPWADPPSFRGGRGGRGGYRGRARAGGWRSGP